MAVNLRKVICYYKDRDSDGTTIHLADGVVCVRESYDEVKEIIRKSYLPEVYEEGSDE